MSWTLFFHYFPSHRRLGTDTYRYIRGSKKSYTRPPSSSSQSFILRILAAREAASFSVSPGAMAAKTRMPLPMEETTSFSTVTEAERTRWRMAGCEAVG